MNSEQYKSLKKKYLETQRNTKVEFASKKFWKALLKTCLNEKKWPQQSVLNKKGTITHNLTTIGNCKCENFKLLKLQTFEDVEIDSANFLESRFFIDEINDDTKFLLNGSLYSSGYFMRIFSSIDTPLLLKLNFFSNDHAISTYSRYHFFVQENSHCSIVVDMRGINCNDNCKKAYFSMLFDFFVSKGGSINVIFIISITNCQEVDHILSACLETSGSIGVFTCYLEGGVFRQFGNIFLRGKYSSANVHSLSSVKTGNANEILTNIIHKASHSSSCQSLNGILYEKSSLSFEGRISIQPTTKYATSNQHVNNIFLGDNIFVKIKPKLEIYDNSNKANHGISSGTFDEEILLYLKSRGFSELESKQFIVDEMVKKFFANIPSTIALKEFLTTIHC